MLSSVFLKPPSLFTIPAGMHFSSLVAKEIMESVQENPLSLAKIQILLPTRRACRTMREAFLQITEGKPLLLPNLQPIGDIEGEDLSLLLSGGEREISFPPAISTLRRDLLLTRLVLNVPAYSGNMTQALSMAQALGRLMDEVYTQDLNLADLPNIVDREDFANHWQISLDFLKILSENWPLILEQEDCIDSADRRNRLLKALAHHWRTTPPSHRIIAAGSTGSIPATADLLDVISRLPNGSVILPGLDLFMDDKSWNKLGEGHPQYAIKNLIKKIGVDRKDVLYWPGSYPDETKKKTLVFCSESMRPSETVEEWKTIGNRHVFLRNDLPFTRYDCANEQEESQVIALAMRRALEEENWEGLPKTAALITPDRQLARRVAMALRRWGIEIDDSAGQSLAETSIGTFFGRLGTLLLENARPIALLDFCQHNLCSPPLYEGDWRENVRIFDTLLTRGPFSHKGLILYEHALNALKGHPKRATFEDKIADASSVLTFLNEKLSPILDLLKEDVYLSLSDWANHHITLAESFCAKEKLWCAHTGEACASFFAQLIAEGDVLTKMDFKTYRALFSELSARLTVRPLYGCHPRLSILGKLESRLGGEDFLILSGLNEGTWPEQAENDPWMSRPMRRRFGLPSPERHTSLSAHDFAQALCGPEVLLTRAGRVSGVPTVPSRWLQRIDTVLQACRLDPDVVQDGDLLAIARTLDQTADTRPAQRPEPKPSLSLRPRSLSVTQIETLMSDPYSLYARLILKLSPLDPHEQGLEPSIIGDCLHKALYHFVQKWPDDIPPEKTLQAQDDFLTLAYAQLASKTHDQAGLFFWKTRLVKLSAWIISQEQEWRKTYAPLRQETKGQFSFSSKEGPFTITGRADRIDENRQGTNLAIVDYKSGGKYTQKGIREGRHIQMTLEALIAQKGGFDFGPRDVSALSYWVLKTDDKGTTVEGVEAINRIISDAEEGLSQLVALYDDPATPYYSLPHLKRRPRFNNYEQLARVKEWLSMGLEEEEA